MEDEKRLSKSANQSDLNEVTNKKPSKKKISKESLKNFDSKTDSPQSTNNIYNSKTNAPESLNNIYNSKNNVPGNVNNVYNSKNNVPESLNYSKTNLGDTPPPPPPDGNKDQWELHFCKWWGWSWVKKENLKNFKDASCGHMTDFNAPAIPETRCQQQCCQCHKIPETSPKIVPCCQCKPPEQNFSTPPIIPAYSQPSNNYYQSSAPGLFQNELNLPTHPNIQECLCAKKSLYQTFPIPPNIQEGLAPPPTNNYQINPSNQFVPCPNKSEQQVPQNMPPKQKEPQARSKKKFGKKGKKVPSQTKLQENPELIKKDETPVPNNNHTTCYSPITSTNQNIQNCLCNPKNNNDHQKYPSRNNSESHHRNYEHLSHCEFHSKRKKKSKKRKKEKSKRTKTRGAIDINKNILVKNCRKTKLCWKKFFNNHLKPACMICTKIMSPDDDDIGEEEEGASDCCYGENEDLNESDIPRDHSHKPRDRYYEPRDRYYYCNKHRDHCNKHGDRCHKSRDRCQNPKHGCHEPRARKHRSQCKHQNSYEFQSYHRSFEKPCRDITRYRKLQPCECDVPRNISFSNYEFQKPCRDIRRYTTQKNKPCECDETWIRSFSNYDFQKPCRDIARHRTQEMKPCECGVPWNRSFSKCKFQKPCRDTTRPRKPPCECGEHFKKSFSSCEFQKPCRDVTGLYSKQTKPCEYGVPWNKSYSNCEFQKPCRDVTGLYSKQTKPCECGETRNKSYSNCEFQKPYREITRPRKPPCQCSVPCNKLYSNYDFQKPCKVLKEHRKVHRAPICECGCNKIAKKRSRSSSSSVDLSNNTVTESIEYVSVRLHRNSSSNYKRNHFKSDNRAGDTTQKIDQYNCNYCTSCVNNNKEKQDYSEENIENVNTKVSYVKSKDIITNYLNLRNKNMPFNLSKKHNQIYEKFNEPWFKPNLANTNKQFKNIKHDQYRSPLTGKLYNLKIQDITEKDKELKNDNLKNNSNTSFNFKDVNYLNDFKNITNTDISKNIALDTIFENIMRSYSDIIESESFKIDSLTNLSCDIKNQYPNKGLKYKTEYNNYFKTTDTYQYSGNRNLNNRINKLLNDDYMRNDQKRRVSCKRTISDCSITESRTKRLKLDSGAQNEPNFNRRFNDIDIVLDQTRQNESAIQEFINLNSFLPINENSESVFEYYKIENSCENISQEIFDMNESVRQILEKYNSYNYWDE